MFDASPESPTPPPETLSMRTRDGVRLDADVYRPVSPGSYPVLMLRQAYGRRVASTLCYAHPSWYAAQGYIVVVQDVRGRGTSEGAFSPLEHEAEDGADAIAWAAGLEGSTGAVGLYGFSYQGVNQLLAAAEAGPELGAIAPAMIGWEVRGDWAYEGGAFNLAANLGWAIQLAAENARLAADHTAFAELHALSRQVPFGGLNPSRPEFMERRRELTHYHRWLDEPEGAEYWRRISPSSRTQALLERRLPMLFIGGWFDSHLPGTLAGYRAMAGGGLARLRVGPWTHFPWHRKVGELDFGPAAVTAMDLLQVRWFDHWLKGAGNGVETEPEVSLFDMGERAWRDFPAWPDAPSRLGLASTGRAAIDIEDGVLTPDPPAEVGIDHLVHDPWRPAPAVGGAHGSPPGPVDRSMTDARSDVLTFTTAPLTKPLAIAGDAAAELALRSDAARFDVSCTLSRVTAAGQAYQVAEGYWSGSAPAPEEAVTVRLRATCVTLAPGERLRLSIAAAAFPARPVNPGDGRRPENTSLASARIITLGVVCGGAYGSRLVISTPATEDRA